MPKFTELWQERVRRIRAAHSAAAQRPHPNIQPEEQIMYVVTKNLKPVAFMVRYSEADRFKRCCVARAKRLEKEDVYDIARMEPVHD